MTILAIDLSAGGIWIAVAAGFLSFLSPCVWPLVPAYLSFVSGVAYEDLQENARRVTIMTLAFVVGFTAMFAAFGAGAGLAGSVIIENRRVLEIGGGILVIVMGLALLGFGQQVFGREARVVSKRRPATIGAVILTGMAFAVGWTPCIGPTLTAILTLAAQTTGASSGAVLLVAYGLGLGIPFLLCGIAFSSAMGALGLLRRHAGAVNRVAGVLLVAMGLLLATGRLAELTQRLAGTAPIL